MTVKTVSVNCPTCKNKVLMTEAFPERPFCSKRCQQIDFGGWASEEYQIETNDEENETWSGEQDQ